jgi:hypothetical protein
MKKVLDSVTLPGHVFATLEKWATNPTSKCFSTRHSGESRNGEGENRVS